MLSTRFLTALSAIALISFGCGDSGTGGAGGTAGDGGSPSSGGSPTNGGDGPVGGSSDGGAPAGGGEAPVGGEAAGGAPGTGGGGGNSGLAAYMEPCVDDADCETGDCHTFNGQGVTICTQACKGDGDCPPPSAGCNNMNICRPPM